MTQCGNRRQQTFFGAHDHQACVDPTSFGLDCAVTLANQLNAGELINSYTYAFNTKGLRSRWTHPNPIDRERP